MDKTSKVIISTTQLSQHLKSLICRYSSAGGALLLTEHISHEIDCQIYGSSYRGFCKDTFTEMLLDLHVPTTPAMEIAQLLKEEMGLMLDSYLPPHADNADYYKEWINDNTCVITVMYRLTPAHRGSYENVQQ